MPMFLHPLTSGWLDARTSAQIQNPSGCMKLRVSVLEEAMRVLEEAECFMVKNTVFKNRELWV